MKLKVKVTTEKETTVRDRTSTVVTRSDSINYDEKAKKDDGTCIESPAYTVPTTYSFTDNSGNSTVDFSGQTQRLDQLSELVLD